jgi:hypothetical protein
MDVDGVVSPDLPSDPAALNAKLEEVEKDMARCVSHTSFNVRLRHTPL